MSPGLTVAMDGRGFVETMVPHTLLAMMWSQLFEAIAQDIKYKKCPACGGWFSVGGKEGNTRRRVYCSDSCRFRACQGRRERVIELAAKRMAPAKIAGVLAAEGHETDLATVKKWIKAANRKGDKR